jgi:predicted amidohydrolase
MGRRTSEGLRFSLLTAAGRTIIAPMKASLRVAAVQMKFAPTIAGNLAKIEAALRSAARRGADAVLFPECATTGYTCDFASLKPAEVREALAHVSMLAARHRVNVLIGSPVFRGRLLQNCLVVFDRRGRMVHCYAKCQLTDADRRFFNPGNAIALFKLDGITATAIICHERRYPELVRLAVMAGARILFHPNAGMDLLSVSQRKRGGRDGIAVRAFENAIYYVFANSVGPQGRGRWSAGDSKVVAPDGRVLRLADNQSEAVIVADLDLFQATRKYAVESLSSPKFLAASWKRTVALVRRQAREAALSTPRT